MPTTPQHTFTNLKLEPGIAPEIAKTMAIALTSGTYARGQVLGQVTATERFAPYDDGTADGRDVAKVILQYACTVDSDNNVSIADEWGSTRKTAPAYFHGAFKTEDLTGLDANAVADLGRLISGTTSTGLLLI